MKTIKCAGNKNFSGKASSLSIIGEKQMETNHNLGKNDGLNHTSNAPDPEVSAKTVRRKFTTAYKLRILKEADACTVAGQTGALLRREGLYSSHLALWRKQRRMAVLEAVCPKKRGAKPKEKNPLAVQIAHLEKQNRILQAKLRKAEIIIEAQKKISEILGIDQSLVDQENNNS